jgi:hypothetical protein
VSAERIVSLLIGAILRSPMHGLLSRKLMLLTVIGRHTGRRFTFPVEYVSDGRHVTVVAGAAASKIWWLNLTRTSPVVVRIRGRDRNGIARPLGADKAGLLEGSPIRSPGTARAAPNPGARRQASPHLATRPVVTDLTVDGEPRRREPP